MLDHIMMIQMNFVTDSHHDRDSFILIKLHDTKLINGRHFPLDNFRSTRANHCFVYFNGEQEIKVDDSLNDKLQICRLKRAISDLCRFPRNSVILPGSHFFTVKQKSLIWSAVWKNNERDDRIDQINEKSENPNSDNIKKIKGLMGINDTRPIFDIPSALTQDHRCSSDLAHYILDFIPINAILFCLRRLNRAHHTSQLLLHNQWWKQRLAREFGFSVTRWSQSTLNFWRFEWLTGKTLKRYRRNNQAINENIRATVESQPIWFSAAIHLQTRLDFFSRDILKQDDSNLDSSDVLVIPDALRYVLLVSPPFQYCSQCLMTGHYLRLTGSYIDKYDSGPRQATNHRLFCFAYDGEESKLLALYSGLCYVEADQNTEKLGVEIERVEEINNEENSVNEENEEIQTNDRKTDKIREVQFNDSNLCPIFEWEQNGESLLQVASSTHDFFIKRGVYCYCEKLAQMWNEREIALTIKPAQPIKDEDNFQSEDDEAWESNEDGDVNDQVKFNDDHNMQKYSHLSPPFLVNFDRIHMRYLMSDLQNEIENDQ